MERPMQTMGKSWEESQRVEGVVEFEKWVLRTQVTSLENEQLVSTVPASFPKRVCNGQGRDVRVMMNKETYIHI